MVSMDRAAVRQQQQQPFCQKNIKWLCFLVGGLVGLWISLPLSAHLDGYAPSSSSLLSLQPSTTTTTATTHSASATRQFEKQAARVDQQEATTSRLKAKQASPPSHENEHPQAPNNYNKPLYKKKLTYNRFGGRLNNQLFQFAAALQHAHLLNRTLVVPPETNMVEWTGMFDSGSGAVDLWDVSALRRHYAVDFESARDAKMVVEDEDCRVPPGRHKNVLVDLNKYRDCETLLMESQNGLMFCNQQHRFCNGNNNNNHYERVAYDVYQKMRPSVRVQTLLQQSLLKKKNQTYKLAVHSRTHGEGPYPSDMCVRGNDKTCRPHIGMEHQGTYCDEYTLQTDCSKWTDLGHQLTFASESVKRAILQDKEPFVLANDGTHDWSHEFDGERFVIASNRPLMQDLKEKLKKNEDITMDEWKRAAASPYSKEILKKGAAHFLDNVDRLSQIVLELFSLLEPEFFVGNIYSTLSLAACIMRGESRKYESNMCWMLMHPDDQYATPPAAASIK